jgi:hypothetical protein
MICPHSEDAECFLWLHLASHFLKDFNARDRLGSPVLVNDPLLQDPPGSTVALTSMGTAVTIATWVLLIAINLWCLRKLFAGESGTQAEV